MKTHPLFRPEDLQQIADRGMTLENVRSQIATFKSGLPYLNLQRPCTVRDHKALDFGILFCTPVKECSQFEPFL